MKVLSAILFTAALGAASMLGAADADPGAAEADTERVSLTIVVASGGG